MDIRNVRRRVVEETTFGIYVWEVDGRWVGDDEGHYLMIQSEKYDATKIKELERVVMGFMSDMGEEFRGKPVFLAGRRPVSDEEYEEQAMRSRAGLIPDKYDTAAIEEELKYAKRQSR